jgi:hypothetical protein
MTEYEERFNATQIGEQWQPNNYGIPIIGDIFGGFFLFLNIVKFIIAGFPLMLTWIGDTYITDYAARLAFNAIAVILIALTGFSLSTLLIEFISGRYMND